MHFLCLLSVSLAPCVLTASLWDDLPRPSPPTDAFRTLFSSADTAPQRLYASCGLTLRVVELGVPLAALLRRTALYLRDAPGARCLPALVQLSELQACRRMAEAARGAVFPSAAALQQIDCDFGVAPTMAAPATPSFVASIAPAMAAARAPRAVQRRSSGRSSGLFSADSLRTAGAGTAGTAGTAGGVGGTTGGTAAPPRPRSEGDLPRPPREDVSPVPPDFLARNMAAVLRVSNANAARPRAPVFTQAAGPVYPYSSQALNSTAALRADMEASLQEGDGHASHALFASFNPAYHHSATLSLVPTHDTLDIARDRHRPGGFDLYRAPRAAPPAPSFRLAESFDASEARAGRPAFLWDARSGHEAPR